jgi:sigma-E factor negative regulatory protein RseB
MIEPARRALGRVLLALLLAVPVTGAAEETRQWLERMVEAMQNRNYIGTFVYVHGDQMESMGVVHRANGDGERERLFALTGAAREVLRDNESVTCILPDDESVMVSASKPRRPLRAGWLQNLDRLPASYDLRMEGPDRVAGRDARVIAIVPRDGYRYGHRLWLDETTHLLLKSSLLDEQGQVVEQVMFTSLDLPEKIPDSALLPALSGEGYTWHGYRDHHSGYSKGDSSRWEVRSLPPGFRLTHRQRQRLPSSREEVEHLVFSDGLATVSVYIEHMAGDKAFSGHSRRGGVNAFGTMVDGYQVTAVGAVPSATVELMGGSARRGD